MASPRDRSRQTRRRIAGERSRQPAPAGPPRRHGPPEQAAPTNDETPPAETAETAETAEMTETAAPTPAPTRHPGAQPADPGPAGAETGPQTDVGPAAPAAKTRPEPAKPRLPRLSRLSRLPRLTPARLRPARPGGAESTPTWALGVLAGLLAVALALDAFVVWTEVSQQRSEENTARALHSAVVEAPAAAERAAEEVLGYRYNTVDQDLAEARRYLSADYAPAYISSIRDVVAGSAADIQASVQAQVLNSGVVNATATRSEVLLFVNQTTTSAAEPQPQVALNRVVFTMVRSERGWLVDEIQAF